MGQEEKIIGEIARELGLNFNESSIDLMIRLLDAGMTPDNLVQMLQEIRVEISGLDRRAQHMPREC